MRRSGCRSGFLSPPAVIILLVCRMRGILARNSGRRILPARRRSAMSTGRPVSPSSSVAALERQPDATLRATQHTDYPRLGPLRWLRTTLLWCWSLIVLYLGSAAFNLYQLAHDDLAVLLDWEKVRPALTLPGPLDSASTPLWVDAISGLTFLALFAACIRATLDLRAEASHHLRGTVRDVLKEHGI